MHINDNYKPILNIKVSDYLRIISLINKNEAKNLMQNADLTEKRGKLLSIKIYCHVYTF